MRADLSNWRTHPRSAWAFNHVNEVLDTSPIVRGGPVSPLVVAESALPITEAEARFLDRTDTDAFVVVHDGQIVQELYRNGNDASTPHILMSATKSIVGLLAGVLVERGELLVDSPVSDYVPEIAKTAYQGATVRHLLDMRSGVVLDDRSMDAYVSAASWEPVAPGREALGLHAFFETLEVVPAPHGGPFRYTSANTDLLAWVMERAAGQPFGTLASERLWQPLGAEHDAYIAVDRLGAPRGTGGWCATARDFARIGQLVLDEGRGIVSREWLDDLWNSGDREAWRQGEFAAGFPGSEMSYRSGWYVVHGAEAMIFAMGIHGQNLFVDRKRKLVVAKQSSWPKAIDIHNLARTHSGIEEIRQRL